MSISSTKHFGFQRRSLVIALRALGKTTDLFGREQREHAQQMLGLGVTKVEALRFWLEYMGLAHGDAGDLVLTPQAHLMLQFDPDMEELGTWWALHVMLSENYEVWRWYATHCPPGAVSFGRAIELMDSCFPGVTGTTLKNGLSALSRAMLDTPLGPELGLLHETDDGTWMRYAPSTEAFPPLILAFAILHWALREHRHTAAAAELVADYAPGRVLGLTRDRVCAYLNTLQERYRGGILSFSRTAGLDSVAINLEVDPLQIMETYYLEHLGGMDPYDAMEQALSGGLALRLLEEASQDE